MAYKIEKIIHKTNIDNENIRLIEKKIDDNMNIINSIIYYIYEGEKNAENNKRKID